MELRNQRLEEIHTEIEAYRRELEEMRAYNIPAEQRVPVKQIEEHLDELLLEAYALNKENRRYEPDDEERLLSAVSAAGLIMLASGAAGLYKSRRRRLVHKKIKRKKLPDRKR